MNQNIIYHIIIKNLLKLDIPFFLHHDVGFYINVKMFYLCWNNKNEVKSENMIHNIVYYLSKTLRTLIL